ncbi:MAG: hypothetical protein QM493_04385 [Sulfurovum sp.]
MLKRNRKAIKENGIEIKNIIFIIITVAIVVSLAFFKIYLSSQIYYESKLVNKMRQELSILQAEKEMLEKDIEALKFKNRVADTIFKIEEEE